MRSVIVTTSGVSKSNAVPMNISSDVFSVSVAVVVASAATYNVEHTYDDIFAAGFVQTSATWWNNSALAAGQTTSKEAFYTNPVRAIRINQTAGAGGTTATIVQSGLI